MNEFGNVFVQILPLKACKTVQIHERKITVMS